MTRKYQSRVSEEFTDAEIVAAISYLDPDSWQDHQRDSANVAIFVTLLVLSLGCLGLVLLYLGAN